MGHDTVDKKVSRTSIATAESSCTTSQKESKSTKLPFLPFALGGKLCGIFKNYQIYMQHLSIVLLTGVVAILACALRGKETVNIGSLMNIQSLKYELDGICNYSYQFYNGTFKSQGSGLKPYSY